MVRKIKSEDKQIFFKMTRDFYTSEAVAHDIPEVFHEDAWQVLMTDETYMLGYIIECKGQAVGYSLITKSYSHEGGGIVWWIDELYIAPEYRGLGLGKEFFAFLNAEKETGVCRLRLEVEPDNERAMRLYRASGFEPLEYQQMVREIREV